MKLAPGRPFKDRAYVWFVLLRGVMAGKLLIRQRMTERRVFVSILFGLAIANIVLEFQYRAQTTAHLTSQAESTKLELN